MGHKPGLRKAAHRALQARGTQGRDEDEGRQTEDRPGDHEAPHRREAQRHKKWIEWKEIEKIRSTYGTSILAKLDEDGRPRARFNASGTATGRFSSGGLGYAAYALCTQM